MYRHTKKNTSKTENGNETVIQVGISPFFDQSSSGAGSEPVPTPGPVVLAKSQFLGCRSVKNWLLARETGSRALVPNKKRLCSLGWSEVIVTQLQLKPLTAIFQNQR